MIASVLLTLGIHTLPNHVDGPQTGERTVFQTHQPYNDRINSRADVAIVYGIDATMPARIKTWRDRGYHIHLMTGVAWGDYQDYYYGRFDGIHHEDEAQTRQNGEKIGHGGDVYYMSPGVNYGKFLASGVHRALEAGVEAVHLEEPEFWTGGGYGQGFKNEWKNFYHEEWQDPECSPDARWHAAKLMYFIYRRALQQVFDSIQDYNKAHGTHVRCYVPTHSLINYASWGIVSPESSLARLTGCDGYIAQVWTGTARTPNVYQGIKKERTFETAFLEYGSMQNLVRSTGRGVWYLADPIEDNPDHDWGDYRRNYQSTLVASLLQPDVSQYEVMPWPERIFNGDYPSEADPKRRVPIPDAYATELQVVMNSLKDMRQSSVKWESGSAGVGVMVSDSLMFERGGPESSDDEMGHFYGLALPFVKRGMPVQPVQLENVSLPHYLDNCKVLLMSYEGMKPLTPEVHKPISDWVRAGGTLVFVDADTDPYLRVRDWWNTGGMSYATPREHLFEQMGLPKSPTQQTTRVGAGRVVFLHRSPTELSRNADGAKVVADIVRKAASNLHWSESAAFILRRGPYVVGAGMDETGLPDRTLHGHFVNLFDPELKAVNSLTLTPSSRFFLVDLDRYQGRVIASAGQVIQAKSDSHEWSGTIEGMSDTRSVILLRATSAPKEATLDGRPISEISYDSAHHLAYLRFPNQPRPQKVEVRF
jgi:hypothetical protein